MPRHFLLMPALGLVALAAAGVDMAHRPRASDAEPYHTKVREAATKIPDAMGEWTWAQEMVFPDQAATELLKPNVLIQRQYNRKGSTQTMTLLLDQVKDAQAMLGHYPPVCYAGLGQVLTSQKPVTLTMAHASGDMKIDAMEYIFDDKTRGARQMVFNFLILPSGRFVNDMDEVDRAAADFKERCYGVAQLQFVFPLPRNVNEAELLELRGENQKTVETFLSSLSSLLKVIYSGGRS